MKYSEYAEDLGFKKIGKIYHMECNGFDIYLKDWNYQLLKIPSFYIPLNQPLTKEVLKQMEHYALENVVSGFSFKSEVNTLIVSLADGNKKSEKTQNAIKAQIESVTKGLIQEGYLKMTNCPLCGKPAEYQIFGNNYCPMHTECKNSYLENLKKEIDEEKGIDKRSILAVIFAVIGALVGLTPALVLALTNYDYYFGGMLALTPILAIISYLVSKAPSQKWLKLTIGFIVLVTVLGFLGFAIPYMANGKGLSLEDYMFKNGMIGLRRLGFGILLSFAGFLGVKSLDKYKKNKNDLLKEFIDEDNVD